MPLIIPTPGQEHWNAEYVIEAGAGLGRESARAAAGLLAAPSRRAAMGAEVRVAARPAAAQAIAERVPADFDRPRAPTLRHRPAGAPAIWANLDRPLAGKPGSNKPQPA